MEAIKDILVVTFGKKPKSLEKGAGWEEKGRCKQGNGEGNGDCGVANNSTNTTITPPTPRWAANAARRTSTGGADGQAVVEEKDEIALKDAKNALKDVESVIVLEEEEDKFSNLFKFDLYII